MRLAVVLVLVAVIGAIVGGWWLARGGHRIMVDYGTVRVDPDGAHEDRWRRGTYRLIRGTRFRAVGPAVLVDAPWRWECEDGSEVAYSTEGAWSLLGGKATVRSDHRGVVALSDGSQIELAPGSALSMAVRDQRLDGTVLSGTVRVLGEPAIIANEGFGLLISGDRRSLRLPNPGDPKTVFDFEDPEFDPPAAGWFGGMLVARDAGNGSTQALAVAESQDGVWAIALHIENEVLASARSCHLRVRVERSDVTELRVRWVGREGTFDISHVMPVQEGWFDLEDHIDASEGVAPGDRLRQWRLECVTDSSGAAPLMIDAATFGPTRVQDKPVSVNIGADDRQG